MPKRVLLLRHAESADPTIFHGAESDVGLSERGRRQADAIAKYLAGQRPEVLVSSGMRRALATAGPIAAACGLEVNVEPALHERRVGALSGAPTGLEDGVWPETLRRWMAGMTGHAPTGAESFDDVKGRVLPVWERWALRAKEKTLVVVAHGVVIRVLLTSLLAGHTVADWKRLGMIRNVGVSELVRAGAAWEARRVSELVAEVG
jgi:broad specificity phosphatase PhoE